MPFNMRSGHARRGSTPFADSTGSLTWSSNASTPPSPKKKFALPWSKKRATAPPPPPPPVPVITQGMVDSNSSSTVSTVMSSAFDTDGSSTTSMSSPETSPQKIPPQVAKYGRRVRPSVLETDGTAGKALHEAVRKTPPRVATIKYDHSPPFDPSFERAARRYSEDADDESDEGLSIRASPSFDPSIIGATFLGASSNAPPSLSAPSSFNRIPSIHVEGLSMDDVFRELEEKMGVRLDGGGASDAQLAEAVSRVNNRLSSMGPLDRLSAKSRQRLSYLTEPTSLAYARDPADEPCELDSPPRPNRSYKPESPPRQTAKPYKAPVRTSSRREAPSARPRGKVPAPISVPVANSVSLPDDCKSPMSMQDFSIFSPRPGKTPTTAIQGLGPPFTFADAVSAPPSASAEDDNAELPAVFVLPPTPELGGSSFGDMSNASDDAASETTITPDLPAPENFDAPPIATKSSRRRRDSIRIQKSHRRRPTCGSSPESAAEPYTPPLSPATSSSTVSSFDSPIAPCFPHPPVSESMPPTSSVSIVSERGMEAEESLREMFARLCQPHTPPSSPPRSSCPDDDRSQQKESSRPTTTTTSDDFDRYANRQYVVWSSREEEGFAGDIGDEDEDDFGQFADAPSIPDFGVYTKSTPSPPRVIVTSPSSDVFLSSSAAPPSKPINRRSPSDYSLPSESSVGDELSDLDEAVVTVCERRNTPVSFEFGVAM
jgi:hypothetical protein